MVAKDWMTEAREAYEVKQNYTRAQAAALIGILEALQADNKKADQRKADIEAGDRIP